MKLEVLEDGLRWATADKQFEIKKGLLPKGVAIYHLYDADGIYCGQAKDLENDLSRAVALAKTIAHRKKGQDEQEDS